MPELPVIEGESATIVFRDKQRREHGSCPGRRWMRHGSLRQRGLRVSEQLAPLHCLHCRFAPEFLSKLPGIGVVKFPWGALSVVRRDIEVGFPGFAFL